MFVMDSTVNDTEEKISEIENRSIESSHRKAKVKRMKNME